METAWVFSRNKSLVYKHCASKNFIVVIRKVSVVTRVRPKLMKESKEILISGIQYTHWKVCLYLQVSFCFNFAFTWNLQIECNFSVVMELDLVVELCFSILLLLPALFTGKIRLCWVGPLSVTGFLLSGFSLTFPYLSLFAILVCLQEANNSYIKSNQIPVGLNIMSPTRGRSRLWKNLWKYAYEKY